jgi:gliding motility-associated-like protein
VYAFIGDQIVLGATSSSPGTIYWSPAEFLSCVVCLNPIANPNKNFIYTVYFTDINGCQASDNVHIYYDAIIYIPNTFTPNNSMLNEIFKAEGGNIKQFKLTIYNRWGEKIKILTSLDDYWDGTYKGIPCQDGTYVWKLEYTDFSENEFKRVGHINLLR